MRLRKAIDDFFENLVVAVEIAGIVLVVIMVEASKFSLRVWESEQCPPSRRSKARS